MKIASLISAATMFITIGTAHCIAQVRNQPAPTGQIARPSSGQPSRPFAGHQPKPTGQIAPAGSVQITGAPVNTQPAQPTQAGQVPKVNTNQDPRTFPERYQPSATTQPQVLSNLETQVIQQQQQNPAGTTSTTQSSTVMPAEQNGTTTTTTQQNSPNQQVAPVQQTTTVPPPTAQKSPSQIQSMKPQSAVPAARKRVDPQ
ncbi:MAG: hypothetical protein ABIN80_11390 [Dyadobacter sp.]|uniref:hypothetical protein n=1 Tax=Dyadobacter sp. TaxID=1914288 RepID=UPI003265B232